MPRVVTDPADPALESVNTGDRRYPVASFAMMLLPVIDGNIALVVRECDRRMLVELEKHNQVDAGRLVLIGIPCSQELADSCGCDHPCPENSIVTAGGHARAAEPAAGGHGRRTPTTGSPSGWRASRAA